MSAEDVCIVAINPAFANAGGLQNAFDCNIAVEKLEGTGFHKLITKEAFGIKNIPEAKHYIFAGSGIMLRIDVSALKGRKTVLISDSHYLEYTEEIDQIIEDNEVEVFCMLDLWEYCKHPKKAYFQPFKDLNVEIEKNKKLTICHSPSAKLATNQKGSAEIESTVNSLISNKEMDYLCISGETWVGTLQKKSKAHIFIDQLVLSNHYSHKNYEGGLGKSGLEGMLLKCLTISCGNPIDTDIPAPPYVVANNPDELEAALRFYIDNEKERNSMITKQYRWAKKYTAPTMVAKRILSVNN